MKRKLLGELLLERGIIREEDLEEALRFQKETGGLLGEILVLRGLVHPMELYEVLAEQGNLLYAGRDLEELLQSIDRTLLERFDPQDLLRFAFFPRRLNQGALEILTPFPENPHRDRWLEENFPKTAIHMALITPYELDWLLHFFFKERFLKKPPRGSSSVPRRSRPPGSSFPGSGGYSQESSLRCFLGCSSPPRPP